MTIPNGIAPSSRLLPALFLSLQVLSGQNLIITVAGSSRPISANTLPALTTSIAPTRIATAPNGDVYFGDRQANVVFRLSSGGLTVVAGNGQAGYSGDGGPATGASLNQPSGFAVDKLGNLYIGDVGNARVRRVDANGVITTVAGNGQSGYSGDGGPAIGASLRWSGTFTTNGGALYAQYSGGIALDSNGVLYIADLGNNRVRRVGVDGTITTVAGNGSNQASGDGGAAISAGVPVPVAVVVDSKGNLFVASNNDPLNGNLNAIRKVSPDGSINTAYRNIACAALAVDGNDVLYCSSGGVGRLVQQLLPNGGVMTIAGGSISPPANQRGFGTNFFGDGGPATSAGLAYPFGVALDGSGNIFVADTFNERIRKVDPSGTITTAAGTGAPNFFGDGGPGAGAGLSLAKLLASGNNIALGQNGELYIADTANGRIRRVDPGGTITTFADFTGTQYLGIRNPYNIARTRDGGLLAAEFGNGAIVKIGTDGTVSTLAGTGNTTPADGIAAASAKFGGLNGLASDSAGNVYLLDGTTLRKIDANGILRNFATGITSQVVATDQSGNVLVAGSLATQGAPGVTALIRSIAPDGTVTTTPLPQASQITGLTADSAGNIYASDSGNHSQILRIAAGGAVTAYAGNNQFGYGGDGGPATQGALWGATGLAVDQAGNLYIADTFNDRVREVILASSFRASPGTLDFTGVSNGVSPAAQSVYLSSNVTGLRFSTSPSAPWLNVNPASGVAPTVLQVTVDPTGLSPGTYEGSIVVATPDATPTATTVSVTFSVQPSISPSLRVDVSSLSFSATMGAGNQTQQLHVQNSGGGPLSFTAASTTTSGGAWLNVTPLNGTATPSAPATLNITANPGSLNPGTYSGTITIVGAGSTTSISVTLSVAAPNNVILLSQSALSFTAVAQGGIPLPQSFGILNTGQGSMSWSATASTLSGGNWLQISPTSGVVNQPYLDVSLVNVSINASGLAAGDYYARIQVTSAATNSPQVLMVILTVLPAGQTPGPEVRPTGLIFTGMAGVTPGSQDVLIGNPKAQADTYLSASIGTFYSYVPTNANVAPDQPATLRVFPDFSQLNPGDIKRGTITLQFSDGTARNISVLTVVAPAGTAGPSFKDGVREASGSCASSNLEIQLRSLRAGFSAVVGQPTTVEVQVVDDCGNLLGPGNQGSPSVTVGFSNKDAGINLAHIGNGVWTGTWRPVNSSQSSVSMTISAFLQQSSGKLYTGQIIVSGSLNSAGATPTVTAGGVVHGASFQGGAPIAPGELITVYGANLADPNPPPGTVVLFGNTPLQPSYTSAGQLNVQVPYDIPVNAPYQISVQRDNLLSVPQTLVVAQAQPGIFTVNEQGTGQGVILRSDQVTLAQPGTPAAVGETIVIYCTGLGAVTPPSPLSNTLNPVTLTIGGQNAAVAFAGLTSGFPGLYQINAVVPAGVSGDALPVVVTVAGQVSPPVTMAVH